MSILEEQLLMGEITFGFELEAYVNQNKLVFKDNHQWKHDIENVPLMTRTQFIDYDNLYKNLKYFFQTNYFGNSEFSIDKDGSLGYNGFELQSPVFNLTPKNIEYCIKFLMELSTTPYQIYTDRTCGFHVHLSFPTITPEDVYWLECNLALDEDMIKNLSSIINHNGAIINFITPTYSSDDYLKNLKNAIMNDNFQAIANELSEVKMRLIRNHPQGTLEWRGPRNFLNKPDIEVIKRFFMKLYKFAKWISDTLDKKEINGYDKKTFLNLINDFNPQYKEVFKKSSKILTIVDKVLKKPSSLLNLNLNLKDTLEVVEIISKKIPLQEFTLNFATKKLPEKILAAFLFLYPQFFKYSIQHQPIPYKELNIIDGGYYLINIINENKKYLTLKDIKKIILDANLTYYSTFEIIRQISVKLRKNLLTKSFLSAIANHFEGVPYSEVLKDAIEYTPIFDN